MRSAVLLALLAAFALAGCGGDDGDGGGGAGDGGSASECLARWNDVAPPNLKALMQLSNEPSADVVVGEYSGEDFAAEAFDTTTTGTGQRVSIAAGDCVAAQASGGTTLFVFVLPSKGSGSGGWRRLSESGDHPLAKDPARSVSEPVRARVTGQGGQSRLEPR